MESDLLFYREGDLYKFLEQQKALLKSEIESLEPNYILNVSEEDLCQYLISKYSIDTPELVEDQIHINNQDEVDIDIRGHWNRIVLDRNHPVYEKGTRVTIAVPFKGNNKLLEYSPSRYSAYSPPPRGVVKGQEIHLVYQTLKHDTETIKREHENDLKRIKNYIDAIRDEAGIYNDELRSLVRQIVPQRKKKVLDDRRLVSSLGIPFKNREDIPETYSIPITRKKIRIERPTATTELFEPEPALSQEIYEDILWIIHNMTLVMERSPDTFSKLSEEEIRDLFLMHLNGHYEGQATGETFNYHGKTDILIRVEGKNIFIAECKIWRGEKGFLETIHQLLGYTSWRDTKTAILIFNKNQDFSSVLAKIGSVAKTHTCYKRENYLKNSKLANETTFSYIFHQPTDKNREMIVTVMAFNVGK